MKKLYARLFLLGFGFFGVSVIWTTYNIFVPLFLANRYHLSPALIGFFLTLDNIAAFLIQPSVGVWSDRLRTPIGRRVPFVLIGAPIAALAFGVLPMVNALPVFFACACMLVISMAFWRTPVMALMPDITPSRYRSQANGIINLMGGLGAVVASIGGSALYEVNDNYPFWFGSVLVIIAAALVLLFIKEPKIYTDAEKPPGLISSLRELIKDEDKSAVFLLAAIFFWVLTTQQADTFLTLYATRHLGISEGDAGRLAGHLGILFLLFAIPAGVLGGRIGRRKTITIGILSMALFIFLIAVLSKDFLTIFITHIPILGRIRAANLFLMASGISWAFININALPMVVDLTSADRIGTYTGFYFLAYTLSSVVGPILNGWIILLAGHNYNMIMIIGPIALFISLFFLSRVKKGEPLPNSA
ncbi:MAG: MFS transporter [Anaerolineaceae bacterium]|jgi:MFS family permease